MLFHYGRPRQLCPFPVLPAEALSFHTRLRQECLLPPRTGGASFARALDLGCGVGRFTLELSRVSGQVLGIDSSAPFIRAARRLARGDSIDIRVPESGAGFSRVTVRWPDRMPRGAVEFRVADAMHLEEFEGNAFDLVAAINLLCRLPSPRRFLSQLHRLVLPQGQLLIASPFSWLEQYTERREWLSSAQVRQLLAPHFRLARCRDLPFVVREHRRKYQLVISEVLTFIRRAV